MEEDTVMHENAFNKSDLLPLLDSKLSISCRMTSLEKRQETVEYLKR